MDASMWIAKTGLDAQQTRMSVISNNLANVNTTGFIKTAPTSRTCSTRSCASPVRKTRQTRRPPPA